MENKTRLLKNITATDIAIEKSDSDMQDIFCHEPLCFLEPYASYAAYCLAVGGNNASLLGEMLSDDDMEELVRICYSLTSLAIEKDPKKQGDFMSAVYTSSDTTRTLESGRVVEKPQILAGFGVIALDKTITAILENDAPRAAMLAISTANILSSAAEEALDSVTEKFFENGGKVSKNLAEVRNALSEIGKRGAMSRHAETRSMKKEAFDYLGKHRHEHRSKESAAGAITKLVAIAHRTAYAWVTEYDNLQSAARLYPLPPDCTL